jgi:two-component system cell cycle response regulator
MKVLIVEPSRLVTLLLDTMFQKHGIEPIIVKTGDEALALLAKEEVDLLCLAFELGDMNGVDLVTTARKRKLLGSQPVLMFTSTYNKKTIAQALRAGITECFAKHQIAELDKFVEHFISGKALNIGGRVLLVEDSATSALSYTKLLGKLGLTVDLSKTAEDAVQKFASGHYDLVLTDYLLAGADTGLAVIRAIRESGGRKAKTPILAISALRDTVRRVEILRHGANDFVGKPVVAEELEMRVYNLITIQRLMQRLESQHEAMKDIAMHDQLTSLYNRHYLHARIPALIEKAGAAGKPLSVAIVDIDHFKRVNDKRGHAVGDQVLAEVAKTMLLVAGQDDMVVRFGGEEFLLVMPNTSSIEAVHRAEELRTRIERAQPGGLPITVSIGVAELAPGESFEQQISRADDAVYRAKDSGRNRVEIADESVADGCGG